MNKKLPSMIYTINDFKMLFEEYGIDEDKVRFYIGKRHLGPKAFGIYEQDGEYVVYKVKANGETAIRYQGRDEAKAVSELYSKFLEEVGNRPWLRDRYHPDKDAASYNASLNKANKEKKRKQAVIGAILISLGLTGLLVYGASRSDKVKYYRGSDGTRYAKYHDSYYFYDPYYDDWYYYSDYYDNDWEYVEDYGDGSSFKKTSYYRSRLDDDDDYDSYDSDWDFDDSDWGSDSYTDWDSDW